MAAWWRWPRPSTWCAAWVISRAIEDLRAIPVGVDADGTPIRLDDVAHVQLGPELRRGVAELDGEGEVVGGVVVMRYGENALTTIERVAGNSMN